MLCCRASRFHVDSAELPSGFLLDLIRSIPSLLASLPFPQQRPGASNSARADLFAGADHHTDREGVLLTAVAALCFAGASAGGLSGLAALFFCGATMSHYTWHSVSASTRVLAAHNFRTASTVAEMLLFIYAGLDASAQLTVRLQGAHAGSVADRAFLADTAALAATASVVVTSVASSTAEDTMETEIAPISVPPLP